jgi:hypothetical protein
VRIFELLTAFELLIALVVGKNAGANDFRPFMAGNVSK